MNLQAKVFQRFVGLGVPVLEYYMKCPKDSNKNLQAPTVKIRQQHTTAPTFHGCSSLHSLILKPMERIEPWPQLYIFHPS